MCRLFKGAAAVLLLTVFGLALLGCVAHRRPVALIQPTYSYVRDGDQGVNTASPASPANAERRREAHPNPVGVFLAEARGPGRR